MSKPERCIDVECFRNFFLIGVTDKATRTHVSCRSDNGINWERLDRILGESTVVTFNGIHYDFPMISAARAGYAPEQLKQFSDAIIQGNLRPWEFHRQTGIPDISEWVDHIDLFEVAPGMGSLKAYGARLHSKRLQDLPYPHDAVLTPEQANVVDAYCVNDRETTLDLRDHLAPQIDLRVSLGAEYELDLRSKSDAQMAEAIMRREAGRRIEVPPMPVGQTIHYTPPAFVSFQTPQLQRALRIVVESPFTFRAAIEMHPRLAALQVVIGGNAYRMGMGGLHSSETSVVQRDDAGHELSDHDVASYYPKIIDELGIEPPQLAGIFRRVFKGWLARRLAAKQAGDKVTADALKIVVNGTFGKLGSPWSVMFDPAAMVRVTLTGQLAMLMLIEYLELHGISVVSANTDGLVIRCPLHLRDTRDHILREWGRVTGFETEAVRYRLIASRDVNNYVAVKPDGEVKRKGKYSEKGSAGNSVLSKNPEGLVCLDAVCAYLARGVPVADTIAACNDIRRFVFARKVDGGAVKDGERLGRIVRWYYASGETGAIHYVESGKMVPRTEGARPLMELPDTMPADLDRTWYVREARALLHDLSIEGY